MSKSKRKAPSRQPVDDSYRRTKIGFGVGRELLGRRRNERPSFRVEVLPDAEGILIRLVDENEEEEDEEEDE